MTDSQLGLFDPIPEKPIFVLGVEFQAFVDPNSGQAVFSQSGVARALDVNESTIRRWLKSKHFERLRGKAFKPGKLLTEANPIPINIVTQSDLVALVKIGSRKSNAIAKSMQDSSFPIVLQQSVDEALGVKRPRSEYLDSGAALRQRLEGEYLPSYHRLKNTTFQNNLGVRGLCLINATNSELAVPDAPQRRKANPGWRKHCNTDENGRLTVGNVVMTKAAKASNGIQSLKMNLNVASKRIAQIHEIIELPF